MATRTAQAVDSLLWRAPLSTGSATLADAIRDRIADTRAHLLDFIKLDEPHPHNTMTLAEWQRPAERQSLLAAYSDHIYRNQPTLARENKPLLSLWAQWYIGLMVPPIMVALLTQDTMMDLSRNISTWSSTKPGVRPAFGLTFTKICVPGNAQLRSAWNSSSLRH